MTISNEADADYLIFPSEAGDFIGNERETLTRVLRNGDFGVVVVEPPSHWPSAATRPTATPPCWRAGSGKVAQVSGTSNTWFQGPKLREGGASVFQEGGG